MAAPSYPLALPSRPGFSQSTFGLQRIVGRTASIFTGQVQTQEHQGRLWTAVLTLPPMERALAADWQAFLLKLRGSVGTFSMGDPDAVSARGQASGSPQVKGAGQTGETLITDGWTADITGQLLPGDYFQVGTRMHMIVDQADSDALGESTLTFEPVLYESPADDAPLILTNPKAIFRMQTDVARWNADRLHHYGMSFAASEDV